MELPKLSDIAPELPSFLKRQAELLDRQATLSPRAAELMKHARERGLFEFWAAGASEAETAPISKREAAARDLLSEHQPAPTPTPQPSRDPLLTELAAVVEELETVELALALMVNPPPGGGRSQFEKVRIEASRKYCDAIRESYGKIAARHVAALIELGESINEHAIFAETMRREGVLWAGLKPVYVMKVAPPHLRTGEIYSAVSWAIECGHVPPEVMPASWKKPEPGLTQAAERQHFSDFETV